jgi:hypothetical protein
LLAVLTLFAGTAVPAPPSAAASDGEVGYQPPVLPVEFVVNGDGIEISGKKELVTPIGTFSIGAKYQLPHNARDTIYVILRDQHARPSGVDHIYEVRIGEDEFQAVVDGHTVIAVKDDRVTIDVTDATVERIEFHGVPPTVDEGTSASLWVQRWHENWRDSPYKPFVLFTWAYDDSTVGQWHGLGWVVFVLRLIMALVLLVVAIVRTAIFLAAALAYMVFGDTGRNFVIGIVLVPVGLLALGFLAAVAAEA